MKDFTQLAREKIDAMEHARRDEAASGKRAIAIFLSACATLVYFAIMAYAEKSPIEGIGNVYLRVALGVMIGSFAILGGEYAIAIWYERLHADKRINSAQRKIARFGLQLSAIAAALSTVSMTVYVFPTLVNGVLSSTGVAIVNLAVLVVSLVGFFFLDSRYGAESDAAENNRKIAGANNLAARAEADIIATIAMARSDNAKNLANLVNYRGFALRTLSDHLGIPEADVERLLPESVPDRLPAPTAEEPDEPTSEPNRNPIRSIGERLGITRERPAPEPEIVSYNGRSADRGEDINFTGDIPG